MIEKGTEVLFPPWKSSLALENKCGHVAPPTDFDLLRRNSQIEIYILHYMLEHETIITRA